MGGGVLGGECTFIACQVPAAEELTSIERLVDGPYLGSGLAGTGGVHAGGLSRSRFSVWVFRRHFVNLVDCKPAL
jgi:hypothetical protein